MGGGGPGAGGVPACGYVDKSPLHIARPPARRARNWPLFRLSAATTPPALQAPHRRDKPRPACVHPTPSGGALRCRTQATAHSLRLEAVLQLTQVHRLVLQRAPQPFDEHVVQTAPTAIHRAPYPARFQHPGEGHTGELAALIGVEDLRNAATFQRICQRLRAEAGVQRVTQPPGQHPPARPVHHRHQVKEPTLHRNVGDVRAPRLIRALDRNSSQQIGIHAVLRVRYGGPRFAVDRLQPQQTHQPPHPLPTYRHSLARQVTHHLTAAVERVIQVQLVDPAHQRQGVCALSPRGR